MNSRQSNVLDSSRALKALFASNPTVPTSVLGLKEAWDEFLSQLDVVENLAQRQAQRLEVSLVRRDNAVEDAIDAATELAGTVLSYAERKKLTELAVNVRLKVTDFTSARLDDRVRLVQRVHAVIEALPATLLTEIKVTAAMLTELQKKIEDAGTALAAPRSTVVEKSAATELMAAAFSDLTAIRIRQVDPLIVPLEKKNPEFFTKYVAARKLIDRPGTRTEEETGTPVPPDGGTPVTPAVVTPVAHTPEVVQKAA